jgi:hypothetical protein
MKVVFEFPPDLQAGYVTETYPDIVYEYYGYKDSNTEFTPLFHISYKPQNWKGEPELKFNTNKIVLDKPEQVWAFSVLASHATNRFGRFSDLHNAVFDTKLTNNTE